MLIYNENENPILTLTHQKEIRKFSLHSSNYSFSQEHCTAFLYPIDLNPLKYHTNIEKLASQLHPFSPIEELYQTFSRLGLVYGKSFQTIRSIYLGNNQVLAHLLWDDEHSETFNHTSIYPPLLDGAFQSLIALQLDNPKAYLPHSISKILYYKPLPKSCWSYALLATVNDKTLFGNVDIFDEQGEICMQLQGLCLKAISSTNTLPSSSIYYRLQWHAKTADLENQQRLNQAWMVINDGQHSELIHQLKSTIPNLIHVNWAEQRLSISDTECQISPYQLEDYLWLWQHFQPQHIIYISAVSSDISVESVSKETWPLILLAKSLNSAKHPVNLSILTWEAQSILKNSHLSASALTNLSRVIENEFPFINIKTIDADKETSPQQILGELLSASASDTVAYRNNVRYIQQLEYAQVTQNHYQDLSLDEHNVELKITQPGLLDSLFFMSTPLRKPEANEVQIKVYASALNFKDLLKLSNKLDHKITDHTFFGDSLGMEIAGVITDTGALVTEFQCGDEVIAPLPQNFSSYAYVDQKYVLRKPHLLSFYQAPVLTGYLAAYRGLVQIANIQPGEKVLIHNATGGVGLAAIQIAQWKKAEIYATAGTDEKRAYLQTIGIKHIYDSRTQLFKEQLFRDTHGYGVDVVINSIAGDTLIHSFNLLAPYGRFIEIGKKDIAENTLLPMQAFNQNISFSAIDIDRMLVDKMEVISPISNTILTLFEENILTPMPVEIFPAAEIKNAFHFMLQSKHIGKVVIDYKEQNCPVVIPAKTVNNKASYIVTGGTSGFGLEAGQLLAKLGAGKVYLLSRHGRLESPLSYSNLEARALDVSDKEALAALFFEISQSQFPLKGIIHSAMILDDSLVNQLQKEQFERVLEPKVAGAIHIHELTQTLDLDFFILFSSVSTLIGNIGQASYVVANGFLDAIAHYRQQHHLPCTSINWGVFNQTGVVARNNHLKHLLDNSGIKGFNNETALQILSNLLSAPSQSLGIFDINWNLWLNQYRKMASKSLFSSVLTQSIEQDPTPSSLHAELMQLSTKDRISQLAQIIRTKLAIILKMRAEQIDLDENMTSYGVDSILAIELVNLLRSNLEIAISPSDFMEGKTIKELADALNTRFQSISA
ncbi:SDR family NAD(P)-dependent oxidoreductase [Legionella norrlandica]|uniref:SDR family NAD(P)-dependent oxidoreductase n=1 Tax=Legionella norrlandica TaxID=1498499 RepID=UPI00068C0716